MFVGITDVVVVGIGVVNIGIVVGILEVVMGTCVVGKDGVAVFILVAGVDVIVVAGLGVVDIGDVVADITVEAVCCCAVADVGGDIVVCTGGGAVDRSN